MFEIQPLSPSYPVVKPDRIKRDDNSAQKQHQEKKQSPDKQDTEPLKHIDALV